MGKYTFNIILNVLSESAVRVYVCVCVWGGGGGGAVGSVFFLYIME